MVKNLPANAGDSRNTGSIPGRSPGVGNGNSSILVWRIIPWTEEPGRLQSMGSQRVGQDRVTKHISTVKGDLPGFLPACGRTQYFPTLCLPCESPL